MFPYYSRFPARPIDDLDRIGSLEYAVQQRRKEQLRREEEWRLQKDMDQRIHEGRVYAYHAQVNAERAREAGRLASARQERYYEQQRIARGDPVYDPKAAERRERELATYWTHWTLQSDSRGQQYLKHLATRELTYDPVKIRKHIAEDNRCYAAAANAFDRAYWSRKAHEIKYKKNFPDTCNHDAN